MSLETALARAEYRHLCNITHFALQHFERSGRQCYADLVQRLLERRSDVRRRCKFTGIASV